MGSGGVGLQVLLAVRVYFRSLTVPVEHSHPVYVAKCQKLTQLLTADPPRACLEVAQGWIMTSTQVGTEAATTRIGTRYQPHSLSTLAYNTHALSTHAINHIPYQHSLIIHTPYQHMAYQYTLLTHYKHTLLIHPLNSPS